MKFKTLLVILLSLIVILSWSPGELQADDFTADLPILITSAGQNDSYKEIKSFAEKFGVEVLQAEGIVEQSNLKNINTLIIVIGINYDKLNQANLSLEAEAERIRDLLEGAKNQGIKIIGLYIEDKLTDADLSLIETVGLFSNYFIVKRPDENTGETITKLLEEQDFTYILINQAVNAGSELNKILIEPFS